MSWNPNSQDHCVRGLEWFPERVVDRAVAGFGDQSYSWSVEASVTETIDRLWTFSDQAVSNAYDTIDIYDAATLKPVKVLVRDRPYAIDAAYGNLNRTGAAYVEWSSGQFRTENVNLYRLTNAGQLNRSGGFRSLTDNGVTDALPLSSGTYRGTTNTGVSTLTAFSSRQFIVHREFAGLTAAPIPLDRTPIVSETTASTFNNYNSFASQWAFHVDGLGNVPSGHRVLSLTLTAYCQRLIDAPLIGTKADQPYRIRPALLMGPSTFNTLVLGQYSIMPNEPGEVSYTWFRNPVTGLPWTTTELAAFNQTNQQAAVVWLMSRPNEPEVVQSTAGAIFSAKATTRSVEDTRVASAVRSRARQYRGWNRWDVTKIGGGAWDGKTNGRTYLFNANLFEQGSVDRRQEIKPRGLGVRSLGGGEGAQNGVAERTPEFSGEVPKALGEANNFAPAVLMQRSDNALSLDSQPYATITDNLDSNVLNGATDWLYVAQLLTFDADDNVPDRVRFLARSATDSVPSQPLSISVSESNVTVAEAELSPDALQFPSKWQIFELPLETVGSWASGAEDYYVWFYSPADPVGWQIQMLFTGESDGQYRDPSTPADVTTFGQDLEYGLAGTSVGVVERKDSDVCVTLGVAPNTVDGFAGDFDADGCVTFVVLSWEPYATDDCSVFGRIEIQRQNTDETWSTIYNVVSPDLYEVNDYEIRRNASNFYRCRFISATGFSSDWSDVVEVVPVDSCCGYTFTSNDLPEFALWYDDLGSRDYSLLETVEYYQFEGVDGALAARGLTDSLDSFETDLAVALRGAKAGTPDVDKIAVSSGRRLFDPLTILAGNKRDKLTGVLYRVPYVSVADGDGNRWFASVETPSASRAEPSGRHIQRVVVREVTSTPSAVVVDTAGVAPVVVPPYPDIVEPEEEGS